MIDERDDDFLGGNLKGLMMTLIGGWSARMDAAQAQTEFADIRASDMRVFGQLRGQDMRLSDIHRALGFSRQAAQQAVDRLVAHGVVELRRAEGSRRDKIVSVTEKGQGLRALAARQIRLFEAECAEIIGPAQTETLRALLKTLIAGSAALPQVTPTQK